MAQEASELSKNNTAIELEGKGRESEIVSRHYKVRKSYNGRLLAAVTWLLLLLFKLARLILLELGSRLILALSKPKRGSKRNGVSSSNPRSFTLSASAENQFQELKMEAKGSSESSCNDLKCATFDWQRHADELSVKLLWEALNNPRLAEVNESQAAKYTMAANELELSKGQSIENSAREPLERSQVEKADPLIDTMQADPTSEASKTQHVPTSGQQQDGQFEVVDKEQLDNRDATQTDELECELPKDCGEALATHLHTCDRPQLSVSSSGNSSAEIVDSSDSSGAEESQSCAMDSDANEDCNPREDAQFLIKCDGSLSSEADFEEDHDLKRDERHLSDLYDVKFVKRSGSSLSNFRRTLVCSLSPTSQLSGSNSDLTSSDQAYPIEGDEILQCRAAFRQNKRLIEEQQRRANSPLFSPPSPIRSQWTNRFNVDYLEQSQLQRCSRCQQRLYPVDKMELDFTRATLNIHRNCFKCQICSSLLRLETYAAVDAKLYCPAHIKCVTSSR